MVKRPFGVSTTASVPGATAASFAVAGFAGFEPGAWAKASGAPSATQRKKATGRLLMTPPECGAIVAGATDGRP